MSPQRTALPLIRRTALLGLLIPLLTVGTGAVAHPDPVDRPQPGTRQWRRDSVGAVRLPDPVTATPGTVARFFAAVPAAERTRLVARYPSVVGNLDGAPPELRFAANDRLVRPRARSAPRAAGPRPGTRTLAYDPRGRGTVVEVLGDLATADRIAVVVPGNDADLSHLDGPGHLRDLAGGLRVAVDTAGAGTRVAVVAWGGYRAPAGLGADALRADLARAGADRLVRFLAGLSAYRPDAPVGLFCHSYGSLVCRFTAARARVADLVVLGSPGLRAADVTALRTPARVWAALAAGDWVGTVPHVQVCGLGHGPSPVSAGFGARVVGTDGARGHTGYLTPGTDSARNLARIALGDYGHVTGTAGTAPSGQARADVRG
ncbi:alpha/beta hydrolase [Planosporangium sp. 12N6]|uniref:alpha/beta hydrolase n=1 Tax=Planosporangium spinosum TaxID=3402278 RepID=UPI003CF68010